MFWTFKEFSPPTCGVFTNNGFLFVNESVKDKVYFVYLKAITRGIILSVVLLLICAFMFFYTSLDEKYMGSVVWIITVLGICYSSIYGSYKIGSRCLIHGILIGMLYTALLGIISLLAVNGDINVMSYVIMLSMSIVVGGISGIIGSILNQG